MMSDYIVLRHVALGPSHKPTGKTRHYACGRDLPPAGMLRIVRLENDAGVYLLHCDSDGNELTDTLHDSVEAALSQAAWEYGVRPDEWAEADS